MFSIRSLASGDFLYASNKRVEYIASPNKSASGFVSGRPSILVMHYTAGSSGRSSANWFANPRAKASAHLTIERDGTVIQSVPFNERAWHAGKSRWTDTNGRKIKGLNSYSVGIELANAGACVQTASKGWVNGLGVRVAADNIAEARHKNGSTWIDGFGSITEPGWEIYPEEQMQSAVQVAGLLMEHYGIQEIVGHDDIAPGRKSDPGPLFDMRSFRNTVGGRESAEEDTYMVRPNTPGGLAIRTMPNKSSAKVRETNLAPGTKVEFNEAEGKWWFVTVLDAEDNDELDGWVYSKYLQQV
jgi:N-acetylmuramoyl-L-alanine amidase